MVLNTDQTTLKYVSVGNFTLAEKASSPVIIEGQNDKRCIKRTFGISFTGNFFPIQLIYIGKTAQRLTRLKFPSKFSLSINATHYSNSDDSTKFIEILHYCTVHEKTKRALSLLPTQKGLVIMDVFKGQMTWYVNESLNHLFRVNVPGNVTLFSNNWM